ncbi:MAG: hypothetical protein JW908_01125 [Anaerolineales bacterium]|nr:hypothetical protein [Anaerolineales bacterium]
MKNMDLQNNSNISAPSAEKSSQVSLLKQEYDNQQLLFQLQSVMVKRFLETQARQLSDAMMHNAPQIRFKLPDKVIIKNEKTGAKDTYHIPDDSREQMAGGFFDRFTRASARDALRQRLSELEQSSEEGIATATLLIKHALVTYMVYGMLPSGRTVTYASAPGEEIPSMPIIDEHEADSAITATSDAIVEESQQDIERGELLVPFVPYARQFYLPQWIALDDHDKLLVNSISEAESHISSMQKFLNVLHTAVSLAPYIVVDKEYQKKRYGMLGQLVNQGRAFARYQTGEIIRTIKKRANANDLNRGLSLSLPYFDDQDLKMSTHDFEIIPGGRIMFIPAFVVRASRLQQAMVAQDTRLNPSTRSHLLNELTMLEQAFESDP